ncbi:MAG TPA: hypothetical protein VLI04_19765 [Nocardioidaceae bacterium]|nr:hypothetical protein [Nocardioidaceae bacterium]
MTLRFLVAPAVVVAAIALASPASAGERTGSGKPTQGPAHANSICVFSGLEDGDDLPPGSPFGPGAAPQNWGHVQQAERDAGVTVAQLKASGFQPGDSCNGHSGFFAGGGGE